MRLLCIDIFFAVLSTFPVLLWMKISFNINKRNLLLSVLLAIFLIGNTRFYFMGMQHGAAGLGAALVTVFNSNICLHINGFFLRNLSQH